MKRYLSPLILLVFLGSIYAQAINITGTVVDGVGRGLSGAAVKLVAQNASAVTGVDGSFSIIQNVSTLGSQSKTTFLTPSFENGVLHFSLDHTKKVVVSLYDLKGRLCWIKGQELEPGDHDIITPMQIASKQLFVVKAVIGDKQFQFKSFNLLRRAVLYPRQAVATTSQNSLKKTQASVDTLQASLAGYVTTSIPVSGYTGSYTIALNVASTAAVLRTTGISIDPASYARTKGDILLLNIPLKNIGGANALSVACKISVNDPYVSVLVDSAAYINIAVNSVVTNLSNYNIKVLPTIPYNYSVTFTLHMYDSWGGTWTDTYSLPLNASLIKASYCSFHWDAAQTNCKDTFLLDLFLNNTGTTPGWGVTCALTTADPNITLTQNSSLYGTVPNGMISVNQTLYKFIATQNLAPNHVVLFNLSMSDWTGRVTTDTCSYNVNPFTIANQVVDDDNIPDSKGNSNHMLDSGEIIEYRPTIANNMAIAIDSIFGSLVTLNQSTQIAPWPQKSTWPFGLISAGANGNPSFPFVFNVNGGFQTQYTTLYLILKGKLANNNVKWRLPISLPNNLQPTITTQPQSQTIAIGGSVTFTVSANGLSPLSYQWMKDGSAISGSTASTLTLSNIQSGNAGTYTVVVTNSVGNVTSNGAVLTVSTAAPSIITQPQSQTIVAGQSVTFSVIATGTASLSYQWYKSGTAIAGATLSSYSISNAQAANVGTYTVIVSNGTLPNATSSGAVLTVIAASGTVTDIDGNVYLTVTIGTQVWMVENLKTTRYNDGTAIPLVADTTVWGTYLASPGYCWYNNDPATYKNLYGALYNWYTVNTGKLAPTGWHVPTDSEWTVLYAYLYGKSVAGGYLKESGTVHWASPNTGASNETGFSALPGGFRYGGNGSFYGIDTIGSWWSATSFVANSESWSYYLHYNTEDISRNYEGIGDGYSVRCIKN